MFYQIFQEGHTDKCLLEPLNIDKTIAIDLFIFNWTLGENMLGSIEVVKCGKILPIIEAPLAKQVKISTQKEDCIKIETLPLSVYRKSNDIVSLNGTVSWISWKYIIRIRVGIIGLLWLGLDLGYKLGQGLRVKLILD